MATKKCPQCGNLNWEQAAKCDCGYQFPQMPENLTTRLNTQAIKPNPEIQTARNWYLWLWLSPLLTIPTVFVIFDPLDPGLRFVCGGVHGLCDYEMRHLVNEVFAIVCSALWHLILLVPALNKQSEFVRWHGRQALLLAGVRTAIFAYGLIFFYSVELGFSSVAVFPFLILIAVWLLGTRWGQEQATHGDCALMRWTGHGAGLPRPVGLEAAPSESAKEMPGPEEVDRLLGIIRFNPDPEQRRAALAELERLGLVEAL